jgi:outer membrane protein insertion porin family
MKQAQQWMMIAALAVGLCTASAVGAQGIPGVPPPTAVGMPPAAPDDTLQVSKVRVEGFSHLDAEAIAQVLALANKLEGKPLDAAAMQRTLEDILDLGWFLRGNAKTTTENGGTVITYTFTENEIIKEIAFVGNTVMTSEQLLAVMSLKPGDVLNHRRAASDALEIRRAYAKLGYTIVGIKEIHMTAGRLEFEIAEAHYGEIKIKALVGEGTDTTLSESFRTKKRVILRELTFKTGDVYNERTLRDTLTNLDRLGIFSEISVDPGPGAAPDSIDLTFIIREQKTGLAQFGVTYSDADGAGAMVQVTDNNVNGSAQRISISGEFGVESRYYLSYTNPWIDRHRTSLTANVYDTTFRHRLNAINVDYDEQRYGTSFTIGRPLDKTTRLYLTARADHVAGTAGAGVADKIPNVLEKDRVRSLGISIERDTRRPFAYPTGGHLVNGSAEIAGFGGVKFLKLTAETRRYFVVKRAASPEQGPALTTKVAQPWVFATRVSAGIIGGKTPYADSFLVGGTSGSLLRGYEDGQFPGQYQFVVNGELRVPTTDAVHLVAFVDAGDAWGGRFGGQFGDADFTLHVSYGAGMRIQTPIGQFHLDYGINSEGKRKFHFGIGPTF